MELMRIPSVQFRERAPISIGRTVMSFAGAGVVALLVLAGGGMLVIRQQATAEAVRDARMVTGAIARGVVAPNVEDSLLDGDPAAVVRFDEAVRSHVLSDDILRIKLWSADGRIIYSDEPRLVGRQFAVDEDLRETLTQWVPAASISDLARPENEFERSFGQVLEVYQPLWTPAGVPVVLELYQRYDAVTADGFQVFASFVPVFIVALALLQAFQIPLAWSMATRLQSGQHARELLLERAVQAQDLERKRIARDVHDGIVQDMIGLSLNLSATAGLVGRDPEADRDLLRVAASEVRRAVRSLRSFLVDIYPPSLQQSGLEVALADLVEPLRSRNLSVDVRVEGLDQLQGVTESLIYRAAQEAVRNVTRHADAKRVSMDVTARAGRALLIVRDDGVGFDAEVAARGEQGHLGLAILRDLAAEGGGDLQVQSTPGHGTTLTLELPTR